MNTILRDTTMLRGSNTPSLPRRAKPRALESSPTSSKTCSVAVSHLATDFLLNNKPIGSEFVTKEFKVGGETYEVMASKFNSYLTKDGVNVRGSGIALATSDNFFASGQSTTLLAKKALNEALTHNIETLLKEHKHWEYTDTQSFTYEFESIDGKTYSLQAFGDRAYLRESKGDVDVNVYSEGKTVAKGNDLFYPESRVRELASEVTKSIKNLDASATYDPTLVNNKLHFYSPVWERPLQSHKVAGVEGSIEDHSFVYIVDGKVSFCSERESSCEEADAKQSIVDRIANSKANSLEPSISLGGQADSYPFLNATATEADREKLVESIFNTLVDLGITQINIDNESEMGLINTLTQDIENNKLLIIELSKKLEELQGAKVSIYVSPAYFKTDMDIQGIASATSNVEFISSAYDWQENNFDWSGPWNAKTPGNMTLHNGEVIQERSVNAVLVSTDNDLNAAGWNATKKEKDWYVGLTTDCSNRAYSIGSEAVQRAWDTIRLEGDFPVDPDTLEHKIVGGELDGVSCPFPHVIAAKTNAFNEDFGLVNIGIWNANAISATDNPQVYFNSFLGQGNKTDWTVPDCVNYPNPTGMPTGRPTAPTGIPTSRPTGMPTRMPTLNPTAPTGIPTLNGSNGSSGFEYTPFAVGASALVGIGLISYSVSKLIQHFKSGADYVPAATTSNDVELVKGS